MHSVSYERERLLQKLGEQRRTRIHAREVHVWKTADGKCLKETDYRIFDRVPGDGPAPTAYGLFQARGAGQSFYARAPHDVGGWFNPQHPNMLVLLSDGLYPHVARRGDYMDVIPLSAAMAAQVMRGMSDPRFDQENAFIGELQTWLRRGVAPSVLTDLFTSTATLRYPRARLMVGQYMPKL